MKKQQYIKESPETGLKYLFKYRKLRNNEGYSFEYRPITEEEANENQKQKASIKPRH